MSSELDLTFARLPALWPRYPRLLLAKWPPVEEVTDFPVITARAASVPMPAARIRRFASMCGYAPGDAVPTTYPHVTSMPLHIAIFASPRFPLRPMGLIHLTNRIEQLGMLEPGREVELEVKAHNYRRVDAGLGFDVTTDVLATGSVIWRETCGFMSRWSQPPANAGRPPRPPKAPKDAVVLTEREVSRRTGWDYARVSGDFNPIHLHDGMARRFGLRGAIVHGMWSLAFSLAQAPVPVLRPGAALDTEFLTPVQLPGKVAVKEWTGEGKTHRALCDVRTGRVHMYAHWDSGVTPA
jgi:acyl dehydratase